MSNCMPKEQQQYLDGITNYMLGATNMSESEAKDFAFRIWQFKDSDEFKRLVFNHPLFSHCKRLMKRIVMQSECIEELNDQLSRYNEWEIEQVMARQNPPLKFEELEEGMWVWIYRESAYRKILCTQTLSGVQFVIIDMSDNTERCIRFSSTEFYVKEVKE